jgi:hypothetical protein
MSWNSRFLRHVAAAGVLLVIPAATFAQNYVQTNLVSDISQPANADGSKVFGATNRIVGRCAASQIAAASFQSCLLV